MMYKLKITILLLVIQTACQSQTKKKMNVEDKTYSSPLAQQLAFKEDMLIPYKVGDKFGYCDQDLNIVIKPQWTFAYPFVNGYARVMDPLAPAEGSTEIMAMINRKCEIVSKKPYQWIGEMMDHGHCIVQLPGQWEGVIDQEGNEVIPSIYKGVYFSEGMKFYIVNVKNKYGVIDIKGNVLLPLEYEAIHELGTELALTVMKDGKQGYMNEKLEWIVPPKYDHMIAYNEKLIYAEIDKNKHYMLDYQGNVVFESDYPTYGYLDISVSHGIYTIEDFSGEIRKKGLIDKNGNTLLPMIYQNIRDIGFEQGLMMVEKDGEKYYVDLRGREYRAPE